MFWKQGVNVREERIRISYESPKKNLEKQNTKHTVTKPKINQVAIRDFFFFFAHSFCKSVVNPRQDWSTYDILSNFECFQAIFYDK